jgi:predicted  nucleic acid-binding Zn-ribbon protein
LRAGELLLRVQDLDLRARDLTLEIGRIEEQLAGDPEIERLAAALAEVEESHGRLAARLREAEREAEDHRSRMLVRERELMSGRIRNPTELTKMADEVAHMKSRVSNEEDAELQLMEEMEVLERELRQRQADLRAAQERGEAAAPGLKARREDLQAQRAAVEADREEVWAQVPTAHQAVYRRLRMQPAVAQVTGGKCSACHVTVTTKGMQMLRRDEGFVYCDNCGRLLVAA